MIYIISILIVSMDQLLKSIISKEMVINQTIPVIDNILHLTYVQNQGAGFGILNGYKNLFIIVTPLIIIGLLIYRYHRNKSFIIDLSLGLIIGGAIGNLIDRARFGYVVDFLDLRVWPVFNLADSAVVVGAILFIIYFWRYEENI